MAIRQKKLRYYYWLIIEFVKKHFRLISLSFLLSTIFIVSFSSLSPILLSIVVPQKQVVGMVGDYNADNLPGEIQARISNGLLYTNEKGEFLPAIASSWEVTADGKEYRIQLKKDLFWNDGKQFTAKEINYKFKDVDMTIKGDYLIIFKLKKPLAIFPNYLTKPIIRYPLVGVAGLYRVDHMKKKYDTISDVFLVPNKKGLKVIEYKFYGNESSLISAYKLGEINEMMLYRKSLADTFRNWKNTTIEQSVDYSRLLTIFFNLKNNFLKEKEVRQAIAMAIDRDKVAQFGIRADSPIPPISWAYNRELKEILYDKDTAGQTIRKAKTASDEAKLNLSTYYEYMDTAEEINRSLNEAGLTTNLNILYGGEQNNFDMLLAYWKVPTDPDQYFFWHSTQSQGNITGYVNLKVDKLLEDGRNTTSIKERKSIYGQFQKTIMDDLPAIFIYYPYVYNVKRK